MKNGDEIRVFYWTVRQAKRPRLEASSSQHLVGVQEHGNVLPQANEICHTCTLDEMEERTTRSFTEAMSFLKASFNKANEGAVEELKAKNEALKEAEKKVAERDVVIKRLRLKIRKLRLTNAGLPSLSRKYSCLAAEFAKVKVEIAQVHKEVENNRRDGSLDDQGKQKRVNRHSEPDPEQSSAVRSCTVKQGTGTELTKVNVENAQVHEEEENNRYDGSLDGQGTQKSANLHSEPDPEQSSAVRLCMVKQGARTEFAKVMVENAQVHEEVVNNRRGGSLDHQGTQKRAFLLVKADPEPSSEVRSCTVKQGSMMELAKVKVEIAQVHKQVENFRRDGSLDNEGTQKRAFLHIKPDPEQSSAIRSCTVKQGTGKSKSRESSEIVVEVASLLGGRPSMFFKMQRNTPMKNLMSNYCARQKMNVYNVAFYFGTLTIRDEDTPDELKMKDRDKIFADKMNNTVQYG